MAKRFTDTEIWDKGWFMALSPKEKCLVKFIFDKCDVAGIWSPNWTLASACIGEPVGKDDLVNFSYRLEFIGEKIFVADFIEFQYGELSEKCIPHKKVIAILKKQGLFERVSIGYTKGITTLKEEYKDKEKDMEKDTDKDKDPEEQNGNENYLVPRIVEVFKKHNPNYPAEKYLDGQAAFSIAKFLCQQGKLKGPPQDNAEPILEAWESICLVIMADKFYCQKSLKTIANSIQEIIQKALHGDQSKADKPGKSGLSDAKIKAAILKRANQQ